MRDAIGLSIRYRIHSLLYQVFIMTISLEQIEADIERLSLTEQLQLMERLARSIRQRALPPISIEQQLELMAQDPHIQREIAAINAEFATTEADGLDDSL
jgi:hypothetical protein